MTTWLRLRRLGIASAALGLVAGCSAILGVQDFTAAGAGSDASTDGEGESDGGPCGAACDGQCTPTGCLRTLATGQKTPAGIAVDAVNVYWTNYGGGTVMSVPTGGGAATTLASGLGNPVAIAAACPLPPGACKTGSVYWTNYADNTLTSIPVAGGFLSTLASGQGSPVSIALNATTVFWVDQGNILDGGFIGNGAIMSVPGSGGTPTTLATATSVDTLPDSLAVGALGVYWTTETSVMSVPLGGGAASTLASGVGAAGIATNGQTVCWTYPDPGVVMKAPTASTPTTLVSAGQHYMSELIVDGTSFYWANGTDGTVLSAPITGGAPSTLASGQGSPGGVAVDAANVYWTNLGLNVAHTGQVLSVPRGGGTVSTLVQNRDPSGIIAIDGQNVYWNELYCSAGPGPVCTGGVMRAPLAGGTPVPMGSTDDVTGIAVDASTLYWMDLAQSAVMSIPLTGGTPMTLASGVQTQTSSGAATLILDCPSPPGNCIASNVIWPDASGNIMRVAPSGGTPVTVASGFHGDQAISLFGGSLYITDTIPGQKPGNVLTVPLSGGTPTTLVSGEPYADHVVATASAIYWADTTNLSSSTANAIVRLRPGAGTPTTLASGTAKAGNIAMDSTNAYWLGGDATGGFLVKAPLAGGTPVTLVSKLGAVGPWPWGSVALDATSVYFTDPAGGTVKSLTPR